MDDPLDVVSVLADSPKRLTILYVVDEAVAKWDGALPTPASATC